MFTATSALTSLLRKRFGEAGGITKTGEESNNVNQTDSASVLILHGSQTGTAERFAQGLFDSLRSWATKISVTLSVDNSPISSFRINPGCSVSGEVSSIARFDHISNYDFVIICISTWTDGKPPENSSDIIVFLEDLVSDFRVPRDHFAQLGVAIVGFGNREYGKFCEPAISITAKFKRLGADFLLPLFTINEAENIESYQAQWIENLKSQISFKMQKRLRSEVHESSCESCLPASTSYSKIVEDGGDEGSCSESESNDSAINDVGGCGNGGSDDVENCIEEEDGIDHGHVRRRRDVVKDTDIRRKMLTDRQRKQLEKEGYKIVGSHSGVKLCRWTKSQLRGRGGCYKHTFYGKR